MAMVGYNNADVKVTMGGMEIGTMQSISYEVERQSEPTYTIGAGTLSFENTWINGRFYKDAIVVDEPQSFSTETLDRLFKSVTMKKNWNNAEYAASLLQQGDLF